MVSKPLNVRCGGVGGTGNRADMAVWRNPE